MTKTRKQVKLLLKKMRQCRLNFADNRYDCEAGIIGEHYATELIVTPPAIMPTEAVYRLCFEPGGLSEIILQTTDGAFSYPLPSAVTATSCCCVTLIGYVGSEQVYKSRMVRLRFSQTADGDNSIDLQQPGIVDEVNQNTAARHSHANKAVLDKFAESKDGKPTYDGKALGGGASDFTIKMAVASGEDGYTVTSCDATVEQIDAAVAAKKRVVLIATDTASGLFWEMPIIFGSQGNSYEFGTFLEGQVIVSFVDKVGENESKWQFMLTKIAAEAVDYSNAALSYVSTVGEALDKLVSDSHTHKNKGTLDKLSNSNGKLQYNGSDVSLKPTYYIDLAGTYPNYTCPVTMDDIKAAYNSGYNLVCRCTLGVYTATLPLFVPMPAANTWIFSGSGALQSMDFPAQSFTIAITANGVVAQNSLLTNKQLNITVGGTTYHYDGSEAIGVTVKAPVKLVTTVGEIVYLVDNTEYRLADITTLTLNYPAGEFECWMRLSFAASGDITVTLPAGTGYIGSAPDFKNGETWELSFKDKILAAQKVGEGT